MSLVEIETTIREELRIGKEYLELVDQKREAILNNNTEAIDQLTQQENTLLQDLEEMGFKRQDLTLLHSRNEEGLRPTESFRDLIKQLDTTESKSFIQLRDQLMAMYSKIIQESTTNGELLKQSIELTQHLFQRFSQVDRRVRQGQRNYQANGYKKKAPNEAVLFKSES